MTRILVVDDEPQIVRALVINLRARSYEVDAAHDGAAALLMTYGTSQHALKDRANLRVGETLLVLGAAGGVGLAAVNAAAIAGAARVLPADGLLYLYGPYRRGGRHTAPSNEAFDRDLRRRNPAWGVRDLEDVAASARDNGFGAPEIVEMPANNLSLIFRRA